MASHVLSFLSSSFSSRGSSVAVIDAETGLEWSFDDLQLKTTQIASEILKFTTGPSTVAAIGKIAQADCLITKRKQNCEKFDGAIIEVDGEKLADSSENSSLLVHSLSPPSASSSVAYHIFTSGTTGTPKGVSISHSAVLCTLSHINQLFGVSSSDRVFNVSSLAFDLSIFDLFGLLGAGGCVVFPSKDQSRSPIAWPELLDRYGVTIWNSVPQLASLLCESGFSSKLRLVLLSGDKIPPSLPAALRASANRADLSIIGLGGATECSVWSNSVDLSSEDEKWEGGVSYGRPLPEQMFAVFGENLEEKAVMEEGILWIGGNAVGDGYLSDPAKTSAAFVSLAQSVVQKTAHLVGEGFQWRSDQVYYCTGDRGLIHQDGSMRIFGRSDDQVKILGNRIELGELESLASAFLAKEDQTAKVRCVAVPNSAKSAIALFVCGVENFSSSSLLSHFHSNCPSYMIPQVFDSEEFPLTNNGKVDRSALTKIFDKKTTKKENDWTFEAAEDEISQALAEAVKEAMGSNAEISMLAPIEALGLSSLTIIVILSRLNKQLGCRVHVNQLTGCLILKEIAAVVRKSLKPEESPASPDSANQPIEDPLLACIRRSSSSNKQYLFLCCPMGGEVYCYTPMASELPDHIEVWGLSSPEKPMTRKTLIEKAVKLIQSVQPKGPYFIGGIQWARPTAPFASIVC